MSDENTRLKKNIRAGTRRKAILKKIKNHECFICGYKEYIFNLELHHVDENIWNNDLNNFVLLCAHCHRELHNGKIDMETLWKVRNYGRIESQEDIPS
jgi:5-methylcytosine-specific restriction endonuclease McrA